MMRPVATITKRHEISWFVGTATRARHQVVNISLPTIAGLAASDTAPAIPGENNLSNLLVAAVQWSRRWCAGGA